MKTIIDFLRKIYDAEEGKLIAFLKQHKSLTLIFLIIALVICLYIKFPQHFLDVGMYFISNPVLILGITVIFLLLWLLSLTYYVFTPRKALEGKEFRENFQFGLVKWEYYGDWRTERENDKNILIVTNSPIGGIAKPCQLWTDYVFEFETKIIQHNSSWIIRARDIFHYVMLQCTQTELYPHFWADTFWMFPEKIPLPFTIPLNSWFGVRIKVTGTRVVVILIIKGAETEVLNKPLLESKIIPVQIGEGVTIQRMLNYPMGSVGFREHGAECAHFRNVRVRKIQ